MRDKKRNSHRRSPNGLRSAGLKSVRRASKADPAPSSARSFRKVLGEKLRRARKRSQLSVEDLADKAKLAPDLLRKVESGDGPELTLLDLAALASALGLDVMDLGRRRGSRGV